MPRQLDTTLRAEILDRIPSGLVCDGPKYDLWCEHTAAALNCSAKQVKRVVAEQQASLLHQVRIRQATQAQTIAGLVGATQAKALAVLEECMDAEEVGVLRDRHGDPVKTEDGKLIEVRTPLWGIRKAAAVEVLKVHGGFAPQEIDVRHTVGFENLNDDELLERAGNLADTIARFRAELAGSRGGAGALTPGTDGASSASRSVVLADAVHEDGGRAGHGESL